MRINFIMIFIVAATLAALAVPAVGDTVTTTFSLGPKTFEITPGQGGVVKWSIQNAPGDFLTFTSTVTHNGIPGFPWFVYSFPDDQHPLTSWPTPGEQILNKTFFMFTSTDKVKGGEVYSLDFSLSFQLYHTDKTTGPWTAADFVKVPGFAWADPTITIKVVPEPSAIVLFGPGMAAVAAALKRRLYPVEPGPSRARR